MTGARQGPTGLPVVRLTFREVFSRRMVVWGLVISAVFLLLFWVGYALLYQEISREAEAAGDPLERIFASTVLTVLGLYVVSFLSAFLALLVSVGSVSAEIDGGTLQAVIARPLRRSSWLLQRWVALVTVVAGYTAVMGVALLGIAAAVAGYAPADPVKTVLLLAAQAAAVLTLGMFSSTRLSTLAAGIVAFSLFGMAWMAGIIEFIGGIVDNEGMVNTGVVVSLIMPSDMLWRGASYYAQTSTFVQQMALVDAGGGLPFASAQPPAGLSLWWAVGWTVLLLTLAVRRFARRDL